MIELHEVTQHYGVRPILQSVSLTIQRGEEAVILGPNAPHAAGRRGDRSWIGRLGHPGEVVGTVLAALIAYIALRTPPGLKQWRLTGGHRMVPRITAANQDYVETS